VFVYIFTWISRNSLFCLLTINYLLSCVPSRNPEHQIRDTIVPPLEFASYIYGCLIYSFWRPPPSKQQRIIITALHPHLIYLQSSRKSVSFKNRTESAVSNSTMSNYIYDDASVLSDTSSIQSVKGSLAREKMSDMSYKLSSPSTFSSGYTEKELVGAKMSSLANAHDWSNMSYQLSFRSTSNGRYAERDDLVGAKMSCSANAHDLSNLSSKLSFRSTSNGRYTESDLVGAEMSCLAKAQYDLSNMSYQLSFLSTSNIGRYAERDLVGAKMSCRDPLHKYSTSTSYPVHRSNAHNPSASKSNVNKEAMKNQLILRLSSYGRSNRWERCYRNKYKVNIIDCLNLNVLRKLWR